jgi:hypothetical protein
LQFFDCCFHFRLFLCRDGLAAQRQDSVFHRSGASQ